MEVVGELLMMKLRNPIKQLLLEEEQLIRPSLTLMHVVLGKLFVQNYRTISKLQGTIVLYRRINNVTNYLFTMVEVPGTRLDKGACCKQCLEIIRKFSPDKPNSISLLFVHLSSFSTSTFTSNDLEEVLVETYRPTASIERDFSMQSTAEFNALKKIINDYIDRVGEFKESLVQETLNAKKFLLSFDLRLVIQTVNKILAQECLANQCTQIESQEWSVFNPYEREWKGQRRDTLIKNGGQLLVIDWLFLQQFDKYLTTEYIHEANDVIAFYEQGYSEARIRLYCIDNQLDDSNIHYKYRIKEFGRNQIYAELEKIESRKNKAKSKEPEVIEIAD